jgi:HlyD family secretion protein
MMTKNELEEIEIRSEEVQEILGTPPPWLVRWGTVLAFAVFVLLAWLSFLVQYPDIVEGKIRIYYQEPTVRMRAISANHIEEVLVNNSEKIDSGQALIVFRNTANFRHVLSLDDQLAALRSYQEKDLLALNPSRNLVLGDLQSDMQEFLSRQQQVRSGAINSDLDDLDLRTLRTRVSSLGRSLDYQKKTRQTIQEQIAATEQEIINLEHLVKVDRASTADVNEIKRKLAELNKEVNNVETEIRDREAELSSAKLKINALEQGVGRQDKLANSMLKDSFFKLKARIESWKKQYLIESPISGQVQLVGRSVGPNSFIESNEELLVIIPQNTSKVIGRMYLPFNGSGKVRTGQRVIVRLESLPYDEYGALEGLVSWKSRVPHEEANQVMIPIQVVFPGGMVTTTSKVISTDEELLGDARVITEEKRFIERIFTRIRVYRPE